MRSEAWAELPGWFEWQEAYSEAVWLARDGALFVEVGVFHGKSTSYLAHEILDSGKRIHFDAWDLFAGEVVLAPGDPPVPVPSMATVRENLGPAIAAVTLLQGSSPACAGQYEDRQVDFLWLDGDHHYEALCAELRAWWPKIKLGGVVGGHDYSIRFPCVTRAVDETVGRYARPRPPWSWWAHKVDLRPL